MSGALQDTVRRELGATSAEGHRRVDLVEAALLAEIAAGRVVPIDLEAATCHHFTPGLYCRELRLPAGAVIVTKIHKLEHPYVLSAGALRVWAEGRWRTQIAPHFGVTLPGTRRVALVLSPMVWTTFHVNPDDERDLGRLEARYIDAREDIPVELPPGLGLVDGRVCVTRPKEVLS